MCAVQTLCNMNIWLHEYFFWGLKIYCVCPAADLLLEELALNPAGSDSVPEKKSNDATKREVKRQNSLIMSLSCFCFIPHFICRWTWNSKDNNLKPNM